MLDYHDVTRNALDRSGGLPRYIVVEAWRVLARALVRGAGMISDHVSKRSWWVRKPT